LEKKGNQKSMRDVELEEIKEYAVEDADDLATQGNIHLRIDKNGTKKLLRKLKFRW
jgi:DNA polymerase-1